MKQPDKKTTCASKGHAWISTSSAFIFRCGRTGCHAMQHCINGVWTETQVDQKPQLTSTPVAQQAELWG